MIVSGLMSVFAKLEALATYVTTVPLFLSVCMTQHTTGSALSISLQIWFYLAQSLLFSWILLPELE